MPEYKLYTLLHKGEHVLLCDGRGEPVDEEGAKEYPAKLVREWAFTYTPYNGKHASIVACNLHQTPNLFLPMGGVGDLGDFAIVRYAFMVVVTVSEWKRPDCGEVDLPITIENVQSLPVDILAALGARIERRKSYNPEDAKKLAEEIEDQKND